MHDTAVTSNGSTFVPGLAGTAAAATRLSDIDGERGELILRGYPVEEIAPRARFEEMVHLLWHDRLPDENERAALHTLLEELRALPQATVALLRAAAASRVPSMDALRMAAASLGLDDACAADNSRAASLRRAAMLVARLPTIVAAYARLLSGREPVEPDGSLGHAGNFLYMLSGSVPGAGVARALETYLNTVIDHGMNASTFTARVIISTRSDMISAIVGAIGALKGPLHGGAPGPALDMVFTIRERAARTGRSIAAETADYVRQALARGERIMGFGHRVYHVRDPRADVLGAAAARLFEQAADAALYRDVREVEGIVVKLLREAKPERRLDTNVEFYTALLLHGVGLPADLFTPTFAIGRVGGWTAHVLEQIDDDHLIRPDAVYIGRRDRHWALN